MKKIIIVMVLVSLFLFGCGGPIQRTYWMRLNTGEEITVQYERCQPNGQGIECWTDYRGVTVPDAFYSVSEFHEVTGE